MNYFPEPNTISIIKNNEIRNLIKEMFDKNGKLDFYDVLKYLEQAIKDKDLERAKISAYYCVNMISCKDSLSTIEKNEIIRGLSSEIQILEDELFEN